MGWIPGRPSHLPTAIRHSCPYHCCQGSRPWRSPPSPEAIAGSGSFLQCFLIIGSWTQFIYFQVSFLGRVCFSPYTPVLPSGVSLISKLLDVSVHVSNKQVRILSFVKQMIMNLFNRFTCFSYLYWQQQLRPTFDFFRAGFSQGQHRVESMNLVLASIPDSLGLKMEAIGSMPSHWFRCKAATFWQTYRWRCTGWASPWLC